MTRYRMVSSTPFERLNDAKKIQKLAKIEVDKIDCYLKTLRDYDDRRYIQTYTTHQERMKTRQVAFDVHLKKVNQLIREKENAFDGLKQSLTNHPEVCPVLLHSENLDTLVEEVTTTYEEVNLAFATFNEAYLKIELDANLKGSEIDKTANVTIAEALVALEDYDDEIAKSQTAEDALLLKLKILVQEYTEQHPTPDDIASLQAKIAELNALIKSMEEEARDTAEAAVEMGEQLGILNVPKAKPSAEYMAFLKATEEMNKKSDDLNLTLMMMKEQQDELVKILDRAKHSQTLPEENLHPVLALINLRNATVSTQKALQDAIDQWNRRLRIAEIDQFEIEADSEPKANILDLLVPYDQSVYEEPKVNAELQLKEADQKVNEATEAFDLHMTACKILVAQIVFRLNSGARPKASLDESMKLESLIRDTIKVLQELPAEKFSFVRFKQEISVKLTSNLGNAGFKQVAVSACERIDQIRNISNDTNDLNTFVAKHNLDMCKSISKSIKELELRKKHHHKHNPNYQTASKILLDNMKCDLRKYDTANHYSEIYKDIKRPPAILLARAEDEIKTRRGVFKFFSKDNTKSFDIFDNARKNVKAMQVSYKMN